METKPAFYIMSDEEFYAFKEQQRREELLSKLASVSKKRSATKTSRPPEPDPAPIAQSLPNRFESALDPSLERQMISDEEFQDLVDQFTISPIDNVSDENILGYRTPESDEDRFATLFKSEIAMFSEILKDTTEHSKDVAKKLKYIAGKGAASTAGKFYPDLLSAYNTMNSTRLNAVDKIANLKLKQEELRMKAKKEEGPGELTIDESVDQFYQSIIGGDRSRFVASTMYQASPFPEDQAQYQKYMDDGSVPAGVQSNQIGFNITKPIPNEYRDNQPDMDDMDDCDPYGYIRNESRGIEVCVQRYHDGQTRFIALDYDGLEAEDYELPDPSLLNGMQFIPGSAYTQDSTGRQYRIIDFDPSGVDISDI